MVESQKKPTFSVIVVAHDRRDFIISAVRSVLNQSIDRSEYEIVVIKNYRDAEIDDSLSQLSIRNLVTSSQTLGSKIIEATRETRGDFISILEDDDLFAPGKLETLSAFLQKGLCYIHNEFEVQKSEKFSEAVNRNIPEPTGSVVIRNKNYHSFLLSSSKRGAFNCSSITVSRDLISDNAELIEEISFHLDALLFLLAFIDKRSIVLLETPLTTYRWHDYALEDEDSYDKFRSKRIERTLKILEEEANIASSLNNRAPKYLLNGDILYTKSMLYLLGYDTKLNRFNLSEILSGFLPRLPINEYLFKLKVVFVALFPKKWRYHFSMHIYETNLRRLREKIK